MKKSHALRKGDTIGIISPASPPRSEERIEKSVRYFEGLGYRVEVGAHVRDSRGYLAGRDKDRLADLHTMFRSKRVRAIFYHRGGFGSIRLLDKIDYDLIRQNPKIIVGYSDATSLFMAMYKKAGLRSCFFGPMPGVDLWNDVDQFTEENFWRAVTSTMPIGVLPTVAEPAILRRGTGSVITQGRLIGGNLTVFCSLMGTVYQPSFNRVIPIFEDIDEKPRRIDAMLAQLRLAGLFEKAKALLFGDFTGCDRDPDAPTLPLAEVFGDYASKLKIPVLTGLPFGHEKQMWTLPYGARLQVARTGEHITLSVPESVIV